MCHPEIVHRYMFNVEIVEFSQLSRCFCHRVVFNGTDQDMVRATFFSGSKCRSAQSQVIALAAARGEDDLIRLRV